MRVFKFLVLLIMTASSVLAFSQDPNQGLRVGDKAPDFTLKNQQGEMVVLSELLKNGPVVITWYRGGWCPYCNIALKGLSDRADDIKQEGATLVALTPELPDKSLNTSEKNSLKFEVLSDVNNVVARKYDLVFKLDEQTGATYEQKFALSAQNGSGSRELPIPATYIVDRQGIIRYAYVNTDYKHRANPTEIVLKLKELKREANGNKLVVVWSSDDPMVAERVTLMYSHAAQKNRWFDEVILIVWGPSAKMIAGNRALQQKVADMQKDGVAVKACITCAGEYGVTEQLKKLGYDVIPMGPPLTEYLKNGYNVITF